MPVQFLSERTGDFDIVSGNVAAFPFLFDILGIM